MKVIIEIPTEQLGRSDGNVWYIPHHGVYYLKIQVFLDFFCVATYQELALNENGRLLKRPDLTTLVSY